MLIYHSWQAAVQSCLDTKTFAVARLYDPKETADTGLHGCYALCYLASGGERLLVDGRVYCAGPGDLFFLDQMEGRCSSPGDGPAPVWVAVSIHPEYLEGACTERTDLSRCFTCRDPDKISLDENERKRFLYFIHRLLEEDDFGQDVLDRAVFLELMVFLNRVFRARSAREADRPEEAAPAAHGSRHGKTDEILDYINQHLAEDLSVSTLAARFYLSNSYLHKIFKEATGTTVNRYITAKRIARAKALLAQGRPVAETASLCGFRDYSNFLRAFTKVVGVSPKKYASFTQE